MRVLHLAPPAPRAAPSTAITAHSFIDEEIRALTAAGVTCVTVSDAIVEPRQMSEGERDMVERRNRHLSAKRNRKEAYHAWRSPFVQTAWNRA